MKKKGQVTVIIAISFSFLFILFAMVVNISFLVTAKINLQNSVDMAAYAGAAQQARFMTEMGRWNYEMRRIYKAFIYDYKIMLTAGINPEVYKNYILDERKNGKYFGTLACCSLQRVGTTRTRRKLCQFASVSDAQDQLIQAESLVHESSGAFFVAGTSNDPTLLNMALNNFIKAQQIKQSAEAFKKAHTALFDNYISFLNPNSSNNFYKKSVFPVYNYNYRLLAWMTHAYRHMLTRIRGVHNGSLDLGKKNYDPKTEDTIPNRLVFFKDSSNITIFENSPISIASKVLNSYKKNDGTPLDSEKYLDLMGKNKDYGNTNPIHNAARTTFLKNLFGVNDTRSKNLYNIVPSISSPTSLSNSMAQGCGDKCSEFMGPYFRLFEHDINFFMTYMVLYHESNSYNQNSNVVMTTNFPLGVVKDANVLTYYTVVGTTSTKKVPFNVFFGSKGEYSQYPPIVAVASARPFGSHIGPYIYSANNSCSLDDTTKPECRKQGFDPLYPSSKPSKPKPGQLNPYPDFSIIEPPINNTISTKYMVGVKYTVSKEEYSKTKLTDVVTGPPNPKGYLTTFSRILAKTEDKNARWRFFRNPVNVKLDDGFPEIDSYKATSFYENKLVAPQGCKNSIFAWEKAPTKLAKTIPPTNEDLLNSFEWYLNKLHGQAVAKLGLTRQKTGATSGGAGGYHVYLFKYPELENKKWNIENLANKSKATTSWTNQMEDAFANAMAVSEFDVKRYIIPFQRKALTGNKNNVLNWFYDINKDGVLFTGDTTREKYPGNGNKALYKDIIKSPETLTNAGELPDTETMWLKGIRGYRVKFVITNELTLSTQANKEALLNPLPKNISISLGGKEINIDLSKIGY